MPSVERLRERQVPGSVGRGARCDRGLTQVSDVLPAVLAQYGFVVFAADRPAADALVVHGVAENGMLDCRLSWELEVAF